MKESKLVKRPDYKLLKQSDIVSFFHMQMPRWLFCDPKYAPLSLESKVTYTFLLNRFQLSKMNGWINGDGEVFIIYPREKLAEDMGISYRKAIACFKELLAAGLIWEHRVGRGNANRIYMAAVELSEENAALDETAPFVPRNAESAGLDGESDDIGIPAVLDADDSVPEQEVPNPQVKICGTGIFGSAGSAYPDMPVLQPNKKDFSKKEISYIDLVSPSKPGLVNYQAQIQGRTGPVETESDECILAEILEGCELGVLPEDEAGIFRNAITRLFYSNSLRVGNAVLPGKVIRSQLYELNAEVLLDTREKLRRNLDKPVRNSTAYIMATLLNNIWECKSDLMVDPYLNLLGTG